MLIPSEKVIIQALAHDIRRTILRLLQARAYSFSELMKLLNVPSGQLNYHLSQIAGFVHKQEKDGKYESTILGLKAVNFLDLLDNNLTVNETSFLGEAYISQMSGKENIKEFSQNYLLGTIEAIDVVKGLLKQREEESELQELLNFLAEIEAKANRKIASLKEKSRRKTPSFFSPKLDIWQGLYDTVNQARIQLFKKRQDLPQFLFRMEKEAIELLIHLGFKDVSRSTKTIDSLKRELLGFETEG